MGTNRRSNDRSNYRGRCLFINGVNPTAIIAPIIGPAIGTHEYAQSEVPLLAIGNTACANRGPKSRAGLIAYPVGPPNERPMAKINPPTASTFVLVLGLLAFGQNEFAPGTNVFAVGGLILAIGLSLGGPTGYAINPARDFGPRLAQTYLKSHFHLSLHSNAANKKAKQEWPLQKLLKLAQ